LAISGFVCSVLRLIDEAGAGSLALATTRERLAPGFPVSDLVEDLVGATCGVTRDGDSELFDVFAIFGWLDGDGLELFRSSVVVEGALELSFVSAFLGWLEEGWDLAISVGFGWAGDELEGCDFDWLFD